MRAWQERVRAAKDLADQPSGEDASGNADAAGDRTDDRSQKHRSKE